MSRVNATRGIVRRDVPIFATDESKNSLPAILVGMPMPGDSTVTARFFVLDWILTKARPNSGDRARFFGTRVSGFQFFFLFAQRLDKGYQNIKETREALEMIRLLPCTSQSQAQA